MTTRSTSLRIAVITALASKQKLAAHQSRFVKTKGGFCICAKCCDERYEKFALDNLWLIVEDKINKTGPYLFCDNCSKRIERL